MNEIMGWNIRFIRDFMACPEWVKRLEKAKTSDEVTQVLTAFAEAHGKKVVDIPLK